MFSRFQIFQKLELNPFRDLNQTLSCFSELSVEGVCPMEVIVCLGYIDLTCNVASHRRSSAGGILGSSIPNSNFELIPDVFLNGSILNTEENTHFTFCK